MTSIPAARKGVMSLVATENLWLWAMAAISPSASGIGAPAAVVLRAISA